MADTFTPTNQAETVQAEPTLRHYLDLPKGVLQKNLKTFVYLGAVFLVIVAALFSSSGKKSPAQQAAAKGQPPQPTLQDNTDNNVQELKNQLQAERQKEQQSTLAATTADPALASATAAQQAAAATYGPTGLTVPCVPGRPCPQMQQANTQMQLSPEQQQAQMIAAKERERVDNSRFASNLVFSPSQQAQQQSQASSSQYDPSDRPANSNLLKSPTGERQQPPETEPGGYKRPLEANIDSAIGQPYLIYEGSVLDTVLMNRLDGDAVGPVKVLVSNPLYSHDHQHVIIPEGTVVLGEAKKIGAAGFGQQRRMAVVFHRSDHAGRLFRRSRSIPRTRPDRRGGTKGQGQQSLSSDFRHLDRFGCGCWSRSNHPGWRHNYHQRFPGIHDWRRGECFSVGHHDP